MVIVGGGFAGVGCAKKLADHDIPVTLLDRHNYQQFQPLLYQVATAELATTDVARPLRAIFAKDKSVVMKQLDVTSVDPETRTVTTSDGQTFTGDYVVVAAGTQPNFFHTPGAEKFAFPLYSVQDATALRTQVFEVFEEAADNPCSHRPGGTQLRHRRRGTDRCRDGRRARRPREPGDAEALPHPRGRSGADLPRRPRSSGAARVLGEGARVRRGSAATKWRAR